MGGNVWLTTDEASKFIDRSPRTLLAWRLKGIVRARKRRGEWEFERSSLSHARALMEHNYVARRGVAGPGRGRSWPSGMDTLWE